MTPLTLAARAACFRQSYPRNEPSWPWLTKEQGRPVLYAIWVIGNDYRNKSGYYGAYPPGYLARVLALFPDVAAADTLHAFSGSMPKGDYTRCDAVQPSEYQVSVLDLPIALDEDRDLFRLVLADPPYTAEDAKRYGTGGVNRRLCTAALAEVTQPGGFLAWLDTCWPMHTKKQWVTVGRILVQRSTNHRARVLSLFERTHD